MGNGVSEKANPLAKAPGGSAFPEDQHIVRDRHHGPVFLGAMPRPHEQLSKPEILLHLQVKGFNPVTFAVQTNHLRLRHIQCVGYKKASSLAALGHEQEHRADLGQINQALGHAKRVLLRKSNGCVPPGSLGQVTHRGFSSLDFQDSVFLAGPQKHPPWCGDGVQHRRTRVPRIHQHRELLMKNRLGFLHNIQRELDFAFELALRARRFRAIPEDGPDEPSTSRLEDRSDSTQPLDQSIGPMVNGQAFNVFSVAWTGRVIENPAHVFLAPCRGDGVRGCLLDSWRFLRRTVENMMKTVRSLLAKFLGDLPNGAECDHPEKTNPIHENRLALGCGQDAEERTQTGGSLKWNRLLNGFRANHLLMYFLTRIVGPEAAVLQGNNAATSKNAKLK